MFTDLEDTVIETKIKHCGRKRFLKNSRKVACGTIPSNLTMCLRVLEGDGKDKKNFFLNSPKFSNVMIIINP